MVLALGAARSAMACLPLYLWTLNLICLWQRMAVVARGLQRVQWKTMVPVKALSAPAAASGRGPIAVWQLPGLLVAASLYKTRLAG